MEETFPSTVDIEMAIDRLLATRFIEENAPVLMKHSIPHKKAVIPNLYAPEYIIGAFAENIAPISNYSCNLICGEKLRGEKLRECAIFVINETTDIFFRLGLRRSRSYDTLLDHDCQLRTMERGDRDEETE